MTIREIARQLGVSCAAVSLGLRNNPRISAELRTRIVAKAKEGGYIPNVLVSGLMREVRRARQPAYRATLGAISLYPSEKPWLDRPYLKQMLDAAMETVAHHGYRMEYFWLKRPGLSAERFCSILRARGIPGLLCIGSLDPDEKMPAPLTRFPIVTLGPSIPGELHRVVINCAGDMRRVISEVLRHGYQRPGFAVLPSGDQRVGYAASSTYLSAQERGLFASATIPMLRAEAWNPTQFQSWFTTHQPDAIICYQQQGYIEALDEHLRRAKVRVPREVGLALLNSGPGPGRFAGVYQDSALHGAIGGEMLMSRVHPDDFSAITAPRVQIVDGRWDEGTTLRRVKTRRPAAARA